MYSYDIPFYTIDAGREVPETPFILAEEGDLTARRERQWAAALLGEDAASIG